MKHTKKIIFGIIVLVIGVLLIIFYISNIPELVKNNQEYEENLKEENIELTLLEQMEKLEIFKEKCIEVRADPTSYYPEVVDMCK